MIARQLLHPFARPLAGPPLANHPVRALALPLLCLAVVPLLIACLPSLVAPPLGAAPLRYRDQAFSNVSVTSDLQYGSAPDVDGNPAALKLDLYQPAGDTLAQRPAVVWVHGGGYAGGDKATGPSAFLAQEFARLGYVTVSINYRLLAPHGCTAAGGISPTCLAAGVAAVNDAQAAVRWLRANATTYRIDSNRIGIGGESAGAITATGVGVDSDQVGNSGNPGYSSKVNAWISISGGVPAGIFVDPTDSPGFLFSGTADNTVPYQWSVDTANAMTAAGVPVFLKTLDGAGHVPWVEYQDLFRDQSVNFLYEFLDLAHAAS